MQLASRGGLTDVQAVAVLPHEVGHHATGANRCGLVLRWLCLPWEVVYRLSMRLAGALPFARAAPLLFRPCSRSPSSTWPARMPRPSRLCRYWWSLLRSRWPCSCIRLPTQRSGGPTNTRRTATSCGSAPALTWPRLYK
ncbi:MAG: hypothetical protein ACR2JU_03060 [Nocardioidaceae bacterium]